MVQLTETWNHFSKKKKDLFGFCDCIAIRGGKSPSLIMAQLTSRSNVSTRYRKITDSIDKDGNINPIPERAKIWLSIPNTRILIFGWDNPKPIGKTGVNKECRILEICLDNDNKLFKRELKLDDIN